MLKTLLKLSTLFLAIFAVFLFIFLKTTQAEPIESHKHICTCLNTRTAAQETKTYTNSNPDTKAICEEACNYTKDGVEHKLLKYQHNNDSPKMPEQDPGEALKDLLAEPKYSCTCEDNKKQQTIDSVIPEQTVSIDPVALCNTHCSAKQQTAVGYVIDEQSYPISADKQTIPKDQDKPKATEEYNENCTCPNKETFIVEDCVNGKSSQCNGYCANKGTGTPSCVPLTSKTQDQSDSSQQPATGQTGLCKCKKANTQTEQCSDQDGTCCKGYCQGQGSEMESYAPPAGGAQQPANPNRIENPLKNIKSPADLIKTIINFVLGFVGALAVLMIIYAGFIYMTSRGNEKQIEAAKNSLTYAVLGLIVVFASIIIVNAVIKAIGG